MSDTQTPLEEIKSIESQARKLSLLEIINDLREKEKEVKEHKEYTRQILKELGYNEKDSKSIIDYIASTTEIDEKEILKDVRDDLREKRQKAEKKMAMPLFSNGTFTMGNSTITTTCPSVIGQYANLQTSRGAEVVYCSNNTSTSIADASFINKI